MKTSKKFEHQIERIHQLIKQSGSNITWDDKIPDPDNPKQPRQIDITIRRENKLTLIECRIHKEKQDVKWIEELIGRRVSLNADAVIAVSASGYTKGAVLKAKKFGIILRDMISLSEKEISVWGYSTNVTLTFHKYENVRMAFKVPRKLDKPKAIDAIIKELTSHKNKFYNIFEAVSNVLDKQKFNGSIADFKAIIHMNDPIFIENESIQDLSFGAKVQPIVKVLRIPFVMAYGAPEIPSSNRDVFVEIVELGNFEITQSSNNVFLTLDLSVIESPANCHFRFLNYDFKRKVNFDKVEILSMPKMKIFLEDVDIGLRFV